MHDRSSLDARHGDQRDGGDDEDPLEAGRRGHDPVCEEDEVVLGQQGRGRFWRDGVTLPGKTRKDLLYPVQRTSRNDLVWPLHTL